MRISAPKAPRYFWHILWYFDSFHCSGKLLKIPKWYNVTLTRSSRYKNQLNIFKIYIYLHNTVRRHRPLWVTARNWVKRRSIEYNKQCYKVSPQAKNFGERFHFLPFFAFLPFFLSLIVLWGIRPDAKQGINCMRPNIGVGAEGAEILENIRGV